MADNSQPTVVIVGASMNPEKFGNKAVRAYLRQGYRVIPVNPSGGEVEGLPVLESVEDIDESEIDRVTLYVPPAVGVSLLEAIAKLKPREFWVNPGAESPELMQQAEALGLNPMFGCSIIDIGERP